MRCIPNRAMSGNVHAIGSEVGSNRIRLIGLMSRMEIKSGTATGRLPRSAAAFIVSARSDKSWRVFIATDPALPDVLVQYLERSTRQARCSMQSSCGGLGCFSPISRSRRVIPVFSEFEFWVRSLLAPICGSAQRMGSFCQNLAVCTHFLSGTHLGFRACRAACFKGAASGLCEPSSAPPREGISAASG